MAVQQLYARASDNVAPSATVALTAGSANANFPLSNLTDRKSWTPFKTTGNSATITFTYGSSQTWQAIALIAHHLVGATVTLTNNNGMAAQTISIPANTEDGQCLNPWKDLRTVANNSATVWTLTITGAISVVAIGEVIAASTLRTPQFSWGFRVFDDHPDKFNETEAGAPLVYDVGVRLRLGVGVVRRDSERAPMLSLARAAKGRVLAWLFIPDETVNDALWVRFTTPRLEQDLADDSITVVPIDFREEGRGLPLST